MKVFPGVQRWGVGRERGTHGLFFFFLSCLPPARSGLSGAYKRLRSPSVGAAAILRPKPENGGVELAERALPSPPPALPFSPLCRALPGVSKADVYFSWHALAGAEPQISHIFIG